MKRSENSTSATDEMSARQVLDLFLTPTQKPLPEKDQVLLEQADLFSIPYNSVEMAAFSWGKGPTVLLAHGWGGRGTQLGSFVEPLVALGYRVLAFDAPAHGQTAGIQTNGFEMTAAIKAVDKAEGPFAGIIAHSLGVTCTAIALDEGVETQKVVGLGAVCWLSNTLTRFAISARLSSEAAQALRDSMEDKFGSDVWQKFSANLRTRNLRIPVLLFHDQNDREVSHEESLAITESWSGAELIMTSGLGHQRILRNEQVVQQVVDFIRD
jgi:pimeloyl-ACP methyl ester carboxylesterase